MVRGTPQTEEYEYSPIFSSSQKDDDEKIQIISIATVVANTAAFDIGTVRKERNAHYTFLSKNLRE